MESALVITVVAICLFLIGINSGEGGIKSWFETCMMLGIISASGYLATYQIFYIVLCLFFGGISAGIFVAASPIYGSLKCNPSELAIEAVTKSIVAQSQDIESLSGSSLQKKKHALRKIANAVGGKEVPGLAKLAQEVKHQSEKVVNIELCERIDAENRRKESKEKRSELERKRRDAGRKYGMPPDTTVSPPRCPHGHPVKVTSKKKPDGYDGIIWLPEDGVRYEMLENFWCYRSEDEALSEPKYKFRRPKN